MTVHVADFGAVPDGDSASPTDNYLALQAALDASVAGRCQLEMDAKQYYTSQTLVPPANFRSIRVVGSSIGNDETIAGAGNMAGSVIVTNGDYPAIHATFGQYQNENLRIDGVMFRNLSPEWVGDGAVKITRVPISNRYHSGFEFRHVAAMGYKSALMFEGTNLTNVGHNFFGTAVIDQCDFRENKKGIRLKNACLNLLSTYDTKFFMLPEGGIVCERNEDGSGTGSIYTGKFYSPHFEDVAGIFRTDPLPVLEAQGVPSLRTEIYAVGLKREFCYSTMSGGVRSGEPLCLGINTDLDLAGPTNQTMGYGEVAVPRIGATNSIRSTNFVSVDLDGGKSYSPDSVNAAQASKSLPAGGFVTFTIPSADGNPYEIATEVRLSGGQAGSVKHHHWGHPAIASANTSLIYGSILAGVTMTFGLGTTSDILTITLTNGTPWTFPADLFVSNPGGSRLGPIT